MIKTNIKMIVTPEQSEAVQKICFTNSIDWFEANKEIRNTDSLYLFIKTNGLGHCKYRSFYIEALKYTEVDADLFIRTNGTCEEFTCEHHGVDNTTGKCIACGEHIDKSDFEPNIQSSVLSSEQLKLFIAGRNFEISQDLVNNSTKLVKELNSELMKATKTTSINLKPECQFKKYGFEKPAFECELFGTVSGPFENDQFVVGVLKKGMFNNCPHMWSVKYGTCYTSTLATNMPEYNLTPIKKPWYQTCKFPCLIKTNNSIPVVVHYYENGYVHDYRDNKYCVKQWRLLTNNEIEELKQGE